MGGCDGNTRQILVAYSVVHVFATGRGSFGGNTAAAHRLSPEWKRQTPSSFLTLDPTSRANFPPLPSRRNGFAGFPGGKKKLRHLLQVAAVLQSSCPRTAVRALDSRRLAADECPELMRVCVSGTTNGANGQCERDVFRSQSVRCRLSFSVVSRAWAYFFFLPPFFSLMNRPISGSFRG